MNVDYYSATGVLLDSRYTLRQVLAMFNAEHPSFIRDAERSLRQGGTYELDDGSYIRAKQSQS